MLSNFPHPGEAMAFSSAIVWAFSVILWRISGKSVHPLGLNLFKNAFAGLLLILTMLALSQPLLPQLAASKFGLMLLSGVFGIAISDTLFFWSLNLLGATLAGIVDCFYSPFVIGFSLLFLGEKMNGWQIFGVLLIVSGIFSISSKKHERAIPQRDLVQGIVVGILAMFFMAVGIVLIKPILAESPLLWATFFRIVGGLVGLVPLFLFHPKGRTIIKSLAPSPTWRSMVPAAFLGSYLGLVLWMGGLKYALVSINAPLNQLNTIFVFILAAIFLNERITVWRVLAVVLAFAGAFLASFP